MNQREKLRRMSRSKKVFRRPGKFWSRISPKTVPEAQKQACVYMLKIFEQHVEHILKNIFENMMENFFKKYNLNINKFANKIWMNKKDVINLSTSGHMIGMHSFSHSSQMSKLSKNEQELEYKKNYNHLKSICKKKIITMSHPLNSYNHTTLKILKKMDNSQIIVY